MAKIPATVGILTYNNSATLLRALESVRDFDDIVIADGGSTDATTVIAENFGAHVVPQPSEAQDARGRLIDFASARNALLDAAKHDWFFYIDSDETASEGLVEEIRRIVSSPDSARAYRIPIGIMLDGRYIRYSANYPGYQLRFVNRTAGRFIKPVHERFQPAKGTVVGTLTHPWYIHTTMDEWRHYLREGARYRDIAVRKFARQSWAGVLRTCVRNLRATAGITLRASRNYALHGFKNSMPISAEVGRMLDQLILTVRIVGAKIQGASTAHVELSEKRIAYIAYMRMPTERAHGLQIMKTLEALAHAGKEVELVVPRRRNPLNDEDPFTYYGISTHFPITYLEVPDLLRFGSLGFLLSMRFFAHAVRCHMRRYPAAVLYSRDERVLSGLDSRTPFVWESHTGSWNTAAQHVAVRSRGVVVLTMGAREWYEAQGLSATHMVVAPDAVDLNDFTSSESRERARARLGLPQDAKIALYVGGLDGWKGTDTVLAASDQSDDILYVLIGGAPGRIAELTKKYTRARLLGERPYRELANNLAAADVLILPNTAKDAIAVRFTSPLKLFAYMAAGKPIVASDLPSIREILDDTSAFLITPDEPEALRSAVAEAMANPEASARKAARARELVKEYTWDARAQTISTLLS